MHEALFWEKKKDSVKCNLCHRNCSIKENTLGFCNVRRNVEGKLYSMNYGKACSYALDPIEKKPFYHFHPGELTLSVAARGCNFRCPHCQNYEISQCDCAEQELSPEKIVSDAERLDSRIISYTYTEPTIFYEYARDTGVLARKKGMLNTFVTNGYMQTAPIKDATKNFLDAVRVDLKGEEDHYKRIAGNADFDKVLQCIRDYYKTGIHLEIVTLVIPGENDNKEFVSRMAEFLISLGKKGKYIPWHFTQFHADYKVTDVPPTPVKTLEKMHDWAKEEGMQYAYTGNIRNDFDNTYCHNCGELVIERKGCLITENKIEKGKCPNCSVNLPFVLA